MCAWPIHYFHYFHVLMSFYGDNNQTTTCFKSKPQAYCPFQKTPPGTKFDRYDMERTGENCLSWARCVKSDECLSNIWPPGPTPKSNTTVCLSAYHQIELSVFQVRHRDWPPSIESKLWSAAASSFSIPWKESIESICSEFTRTHHQVALMFFHSADEKTRGKFARIADKWVECLTDTRVTAAKGCKFSLCKFNHQDWFISSQAQLFSTSLIIELNPNYFVSAES